MLERVPRTFALVFADREPLAWVLDNGLMATREYVDPHRQRAVQAVSAGDRLVFYATRGCFRNPTRDEARLIGFGCAMHSVADLPAPVELRGRVFRRGFGIRVEGLAPLRAGLSVRDLAPRLAAVQDPAHWGNLFRQAVVPLRAADAELIDHELRPLCPPPQAHRDDYLRWLAPRSQ